MQATQGVLGYILTKDNVIVQHAFVIVSGNDEHVYQSIREFDDNCEKYYCKWSLLTSPRMAAFVNYQISTDAILHVCNV